MSSSELQTFISAEQIQTRIQEMALEISSEKFRKPAPRIPSLF